MKKSILVLIVLLVFAFSAIGVNAETFTNNFDSNLDGFTNYLGGNWVIEDGMMVQTLENQDPENWTSNMTFDQTVSNFTLTADMYGQSGGWIGLHFYKANPEDDFTQSGYLLLIDPYGASTTNDLAAGGGIIGGAQGVANYGDWNNLELIADNGYFSVYLNGELAYEFENTTFTSGYLAFVSGNGISKVDNVTITSDDIVLASDTTTDDTTTDDTTTDDTTDDSVDVPQTNDNLGLALLILALSSGLYLTVRKKSLA